MARNPDAPSRMDVLILSTLARKPMHGYEIKLELRYKHARWWAKCEHGHLYIALARLARGGFNRVLAERARRSGGRRTFALTPAGRRRLDSSLEALAHGPDATYFDVDLFLAGAFTLDRDRAVALLSARADALDAQRAEAETLRREMSGNVPTVGRLIMDHRIDHLAREASFARRSAEALAAEKSWGPYLGTETIEDFVRRTRVRIEPASNGVTSAGRTRRERPRRLHARPG